jgi:hypothetical protein
LPTPNLKPGFKRKNVIFAYGSGGWFSVKVLTKGYVEQNNGPNIGYEWAFEPTGLSAKPTLASG